MRESVTQTSISRLQWAFDGGHATGTTIVHDLSTAGHDVHMSSIANVTLPIQAVTKEIEGVPHIIKEEEALATKSKR